MTGVQGGRCLGGTGLWHKVSCVASVRRENVRGGICPVAGVTDVGIGNCRGDECQDLQ